MTSIKKITTHFLSNPPSKAYFPLATEQYLFEQLDKSQTPVILLWESPTYFVVLGHANPIKTEVNLENCAQDKVPVYRRISGGGTVLQGPGCLNYSYLFPINAAPQLETITNTNRFFLEATLSILNSLNISGQIKGTSDLTTDSIKFSGNAQKRSREGVLFHGTILYGFDLDKIDRYLHHPSKQPEYRASRPHAAFLQNIRIQPEDFFKQLNLYWGSTQDSVALPSDLLSQYGPTTYENENWNHKF